MGEKPTILRNPDGDAEFAAAVENALTESVTASSLQERLRAQYPRVVVRPRDLTGERGVVWYAYRDGHWVSG
jgi:hypothetical protein